MKLEKKTIPYLNGSNFSSGLIFPVAESEKTIPLRLDYIESLIKGKDVIHLGCADHLQIIKDKIKKGRWLHQKISDHSKSCLGIDINCESIKFIKEELDYSDVICADVTDENIITEIISKKWDYLIAGEIIEHLNNPVLFLKTLRNYYSDYIERIVITVPNAFRIDNFKSSLKHQEFINSDHRYWFTPFTLAKILTQAGFHVEYFQLFQDYKVSRKKVLRRFLLKKFPALRNTIIMIARFN